MQTGSTGSTTGSSLWLNGQSTGLSYQGTDDRSFDGKIPSYTAHWQVFLPPLAVAAAYLLVWTGLSFNHLADATVSRLMLITAVIIIPILIALAFLRLQTIRLQVMSGFIRFHPGWPRGNALEIPADLISDVEVRKGPVAQHFGGGTLRINLVTGHHTCVSDLEKPERAKMEIDTMLRRHRNFRAEVFERLYHRFGRV